MKMSRLLHKLYANFFGYFWLPCPLCGEMFGGHEWTSGGSIMTSWNTREGVCSNCHDKAEAYNEKWIEENPHQPRICLFE